MNHKLQPQVKIAIVVVIRKRKPDYIHVIERYFLIHFEFIKKLMEFTIWTAYFNRSNVWVFDVGPSIISSYIPPQLKRKLRQAFMNALRYGMLKQFCRSSLGSRDRCCCHGNRCLFSNFLPAPAKPRQQAENKAHTDERFHQSSTNVLLVLVRLIPPSTSL